MPDRPPADPPVAGFAKCRRCTYLRSGTPGRCFACFRSTLPFRTPSCAVCDHPLEFEGVCNNPICGWSLGSREFEWVRALSLRSGEMERAINDFKYEGHHEFARVFARLLLGYLADHAPLFRSFDLVIPSPGYAGPGATRDFDHTGDVLAAAAEQEPGNWPFAFGVIEKTAPTARMMEAKWAERKRIAEGPLRAALRVSEPARVREMSVLVFDDVFTEGFTIREVARALKIAGATRVCEVVLARQPWKA